MAHKTTLREINDNRITVNTEELASMLGCGLHTARVLGEEAGASIRVGRRTLWNVEKLKAFVNGPKVGNC